MKTNQNTSPPKLQPPGAGLPLSQLVMLKLWYGPIVSKRMPPEECRKNYESLTQKLIAIAGKISPEKRKIKFLVDPMPGLEDSSRYWSIDDLLEHLMIVSRNVEKVIFSLASGQLPHGKADIAAVKPKGANGDILAEYIAYAPDLMKRVDESLQAPGMNFESKLSFKHPWFGRFTARQWYWLFMAHQAIHYGQAKAISKGIASDV